MKPIEERFLSRVDRSPGTDCWIWLGRIDGDGYGCCLLVGLNTRQAHRAAYQLFVGPIPEGMDIDHTCRIRHCVNPSHLRPLDLNLNRQQTSWALRTHCVNGHEFTPENTRIAINQGRRAKRVRHCRACVRANTARYRAKRRVS